MKIYLDPGHGGSDSGATANGLREKNITLAIATRIRNILVNEYQNVSVRMSRTGDQTVSLAERTNDANKWGADFFLSIHINAGGGTGYEDYIHSALSDTSKTAQLRNVIHAEIVRQNGLRNRGKKKADFQVLRNTRMHAMLTENGFIDHKEDAAKMKSSTWLDKVAKGHVNGVVKAFSLQKSLNLPDDGKVLYKVVTGSFKSLENAQVQVMALETKGFPSFIDPVKVNGITYYRTITGVFSDRSNADKQLAAVKSAGFDAFLTVVKS